MLPMPSSQDAQVIAYPLQCSHLHKPPAPLPKWKLTSLSPKFNLNTTLKDKCHVTAAFRGTCPNSCP